MSALSLINGKPGDQITITDRGLAYADGLFETIAVRKGKAELLPFHYRRLQASCVRLNLCVDFSALSVEINTLLQQADPEKTYVLKIIVTREASARGYAYAENIGAERILSLSEAVQDFALLRSKGVQLRYCDTQLSVNPALAGIKHLARLENVLARAEWRDASIYEGLMSDIDGNVIEGTMSNIFAVNNGVLVTPHLDRCGVAGVMREYILNDLAPSLQLPVSFDRMQKAEVNSADELFISNSLIGVLPVIAVAQFNKPVGPVTQSLQKALQERLYA